MPVSAKADARDARAGRGQGLIKKLFIKTYGCQMNVYDSARMADVMAPYGYRAVDSPETADLVILNTCHIRERASEKVFSEIGRLARLKEERAASGRRLVIGIAGCVAQAEGHALAVRAPAVDIIVGPQAYHRLPALAAAAIRAPLAGRRGEAAIDTDFPIESKFDHLPDPAIPSGPAAFLTIQEGCDKFCTFCVVPYTRGAEASRPAEKVEAEARRLVDRGAVEIMLLGQNVNAYRGAGADGVVGFGAVLRRIGAIRGLRRLRYTTSHPRDVDAAQIAAHRAVPTLMPYLHLPVQSGSDRILFAMNRRHTAAQYLRAVERLRAARPDLALSADFIVGFPGETDADFEATLALARTVGYAQAYTFKYSARPGTPATERADQIAETTKAERLARLRALLDSQQHAFNRAAVGRTMDVLLERAGARPGQLLGRSAHMQSVHVTVPEALLGRIVAVRIRAAGPNSLSGELVAANESAPEVPRRPNLAHAGGTAD